MEDRVALSTANDLSPLDYRSTLPLQAGVDDEPVYFGLRLSAWIKIAVVGALFCAIFWPNLRRLWEKTNPFYGEANWGHAICVPLIGLYYLYVNREDLLKAPVKPMLWGRFLRWQRLGVAAVLGIVGVGMFQMSDVVLEGSILGTVVKGLGSSALVLGVLILLFDWGIATLLTGLLMYSYGIYPGQNDFIKDFGMVVTLFGTVLLMCGWSVMKITWFPIAFLVCAIPWPGLVYSLIAGPLQVLAAHAAVGTLQATGVTSFQSGTKIFIEGYGGDIRTLNVAEACAGLRSLMTFISIGAAVAFLSSRPLWQKLLLTFSSIVIAILCNVARVSGQGLLDHYVSQQLSESFAHQFVGMIMLVPAFFLILLVGWLMDKIFVDEVDERAALAASARVAVPTGPATFAVPIPRVSLPRPSETQTIQSRTPIARAPAEEQAPPAPKASRTINRVPLRPAVAPREAQTVASRDPQNVAPVSAVNGQPVSNGHDAARVVPSNGTHPNNGTKPSNGTHPSNGTSSLKPSLATVKPPPPAGSRPLMRRTMAGQSPTAGRKGSNVMPPPPESMTSGPIGPSGQVGTSGQAGTSGETEAVQADRSSTS